MSCVLALSPGIRLHGDGIKTGQLHQPIFQLLNHFLHSLCLLYGTMVERPTLSQVTGSSHAGVQFIVQDPMESWHDWAKSFSRGSAVAHQFGFRVVSMKTGWLKKSDSLCKLFGMPVTEELAWLSKEFKSASAPKTLRSLLTSSGVVVSSRLIPRRAESITLRLTLASWARCKIPGCFVLVSMQRVSKNSSFEANPPLFKPCRRRAVRVCVLRWSFWDRLDHDKPHKN